METIKILVDIMRNGQSEIARLAAAEKLLDSGWRRAQWISAEERSTSLSSTYQIVKFAGTPIKKPPHFRAIEHLGDED